MVCVIKLPKTCVLKCLGYRYILGPKKNNVHEVGDLPIVPKLLNNRLLVTCPPKKFGEIWTVHYLEMIWWHRLGNDIMLWSIPTARNNNLIPYLVQVM